LFSQKTHRALFLFGACSLAFGMMLGAVPTSVPQFILLGNWLLEMDFGRKWRELRNNKLFWVLISLYLVHIIGLIYTNDMNDGLKDIRIKLPLFILPLVFFTTRPFSKNEFHFLLYCFLFGSVLNVAWCYIYSFILHKNEIARSASRFMSHIRLGLYLNMAISACVYFLFVHRESIKKVGFVFLILIYLFAMYALGLASGFVNFFILFFLASCYLLSRLNGKLKATLIVVLVTLIFSVCYYVKKVYDSQVLVNKSPYNTVQLKNANGHWYSHLDIGGSQKENGNYVFINIQFEELKKEWNKRCPSDTFSYQPQHNLKRYEVLLRYLTSKSLTKDSLGIWQLDEEDIKNIQANINNYQTKNWSYLHKRVYEMVYEYDEYRNERHINGHSLTMRPYFWSAALLCIKQHPLIGAGTGDVQKEMDVIYASSQSPLHKDWYKRPHNQFLTITVALGFIGLVIFLVSLFWPIYYLKNNFHVLWYPFFVLAIMSFFLEDTLESQAGITFFAFFNTLFLSKAWYRKNGTIEN
jgi:hypothetical protein